MARVRRPYWLPYSALYWGFFNFIFAMMSELAMNSSGVLWAGRFPLTLTLLAAFGALAFLYILGRAAVVGADGAPRWWQARLPDPGEPAPGNRLAWPGSDGLAPRVATAVARALTRKRRPVPRDLGSAPKELFVLPVIGFTAAVFLSIAIGVAALVFPMPFSVNAIFMVWALWGVAAWSSLTAAIALKTRRLNEDA